MTTETGSTPWPTPPPPPTAPWPGWRRCWAASATATCTSPTATAAGRRPAVSHISLSTLVWLGDMERLRQDPELGFFFREEIGHDAMGYPPPTVELARRRVASTRRTLAALPATDPAILDRTVEIPDLGTMTVADWTPLIVGHLTGHADQALDVLPTAARYPRGPGAGGRPHRAARGPGRGPSRAGRPSRLGGGAGGVGVACGTDAHQYEGRIDTPFPRPRARLRRAGGQRRRRGGAVAGRRAGGGQAVAALRGVPDCAAGRLADCPRG